VFAFVACCLPLASCSFPGSVKPTVKIGLVAPFEGLYRELGYEALYAVRLAVRQRNEVGGVGGSHLIELVALNDFNESGEAVVQARKMAVDAGVLGMLGGWSPETAHSAGAECDRLGLAFLAPGDDLLGESVLLLADPEFIQDYKAQSGGVQPGQAAAWAYMAANRLLDAFDVASRAEGTPSRAGVQAALKTDY
jgi:ABC-type branched-subunit amino acid transport system substrate-binding protein